MRTWQKWLPKYRLLVPFLILCLHPIIDGAIQGFLFSRYTTHWLDNREEAFARDIKDSLNDWGIGAGVQTFQQFQDKANDFHLERINSFDHAQKLGFLRPLEDTNPDTMTLDGISSLDTLVYNTNATGVDARPREQWLFLTTYAWSPFHPWNQAFDEILQYAYVDSKLNSSGFHFAECADTAEFLCAAWHTRAPALVQFLIEDDPVPADGGYTYPYPVEQLKPVTVKVIELPTDPFVFLGLSPGTFPSYTQQMRSIMGKSYVKDQYGPFSMVQQVSELYSEWYHVTYLKMNSWPRLWLDVGKWLQEHVFEPLAIDGFISYVQGFAWTISSGLTFILSFIWGWIYSALNNFLGLPSFVERIVYGPRDSLDPFEIVFGGLLNFGQKQNPTSIGYPWTAFEPSETSL